VAKIAQFCKERGGRYGVFGVQCSVMGDLKQNKISSLKCLIVAFLALEDKEVL
jgi:hypothetical protein